MHEWQQKAVCVNDKDVNPEWFFPADDPTVTRAYYDLARAACRRCPVVAECLAHAASFEERPLGIFGGLSEAERSRKRTNQSKWYSENRDRALAARRERERAKRANESPEEKALRLAKRYGKVTS
jgi:WhiB family redox-sensing transcriptional regulator